MPDAPDNLVLEMLRDIDADLSKVQAILAEQSACLTRIERTVAGIQRDRMERSLTQD